MGGVNGAQMHMWHSYFERANIDGLDSANNIKTLSDQVIPGWSCFPYEYRHNCDRAALFSLDVFSPPQESTGLRPVSMDIVFDSSRHSRQNQEKQLLAMWPLVTFLNNN